MHSPARVFAKISSCSIQRSHRLLNRTTGDFISYSCGAITSPQTKPEILAAEPSFRDAIYRRLGCEHHRGWIYCCYRDFFQLSYLLAHHCQQHEYVIIIPLSPADMLPAFTFARLGLFADE